MRDFVVGDKVRFELCSRTRLAPRYCFDEDEGGANIWKEGTVTIIDESNKSFAVKCADAEVLDWFWPQPTRKDNSYGRPGYLERINPRWIFNKRYASFHTVEMQCECGAMKEEDISVLHGTRQASCGSCFQQLPIDLSTWPGFLQTGPEEKKDVCKCDIKKLWSFGHDAGCPERK